MTGSRDGDNLKSRREQARDSRWANDSCCVAVLRAAGATALVVALVWRWAR